MTGKFTFIDLFSGIGGFRLALEAAGGECIGFSEIFKDAISAYCANFEESESANFGDITKIKELPAHDFMTAGVPCQSWSIAGKNLGFDDDRGQLWNDTLYLLNKVRPKVFLFENVKGLADPRNAEALRYILERIRLAGYHAQHFILNSYDYGVPQTRVRIYIIGFKDEKFFQRFHLPQPVAHKTRLSDVIDGASGTSQKNLRAVKGRQSLSCNENGFNNYFLFNDLRNGETTLHSWDILPTTLRQKSICYLLLHNRRKKIYGNLDGNPLSLRHFQYLDATIRQEEIDGLVGLGILKEIRYKFKITNAPNSTLNEAEKLLVENSRDGYLNIDELKVMKPLKKMRVNVSEALAALTEKGITVCVETRYDFKNTKISTGLFGINRIFLPSSDIYPTLVASDTRDYITPVEIEAETIAAFREKFMQEVFLKKNYRQISKSEACRIQGFPADYKLPAARARWMHLIGNSVSVPVIKQLAEAIVDTGVFGSVKNGRDSFQGERQPRPASQPYAFPAQIPLGF